MVVTGGGDSRRLSEEWYTVPDNFIAWMALHRYDDTRGRITTHPYG